nr:MAG TPA: hypothetical protein [Bacteriophage sp.]
MNYIISGTSWQGAYFLYPKLIHLTKEMIS